MTPKEHYEARKAERKKLAEMDEAIRHRTDQIQVLDLIDRFVTSVERIADVMERDCDAARADGSPAIRRRSA